MGRELENWNFGNDGSPGEERDADVQVDRTTGVEIGEKKKGEFIVDKRGVSRYTGSLNELDAFVDKELGLGNDGSEQTSGALTDEVDTEATGNTVLSEWTEISGHMKRVLTVSELSTLDDEIQGAINVVGTHGAEEIAAAIGDMSEGVKDVVLKVLSEGVENLGSAAGAHEAILRALRTEAKQAEWYDAVAKFPAVLQEAIDSESEDDD